MLQPVTQPIPYSDIVHCPNSGGMKKRTAGPSRGSQGTPNLFPRNSGTSSCQGSASLFRHIGDTDNQAVFS